MDYDNLFSDFKALFLEDEEWFVNECKNKNVDDTDGMHVIFGMVVIPYLLDVAIASTDKLKQAFSFIEKMEISEDSKIAEVVEFSILENLMGEPEKKVKTFLEYMGEETRRAYDDISKWYKSQNN